MSIITTEHNSLTLAKLNGVKIENKLASGCDKEVYEFDSKIKDYKNSIFNLVTPTQMNIEENVSYVNQIMEFSKMIPRVSIPEAITDLSIPTFKKIKIEANDSKEIRSLIMKINKKTQTFCCDHSKLESKLICYQSDLLALRKKKEVKALDEFYLRLAKYVWKIEQKDKRGKVFKEFFIEPNEIDIVVQNAVDLSGDILKFNSKYHDIRCAKCAKMIKEYDYAVEEIEELRYEAEEELKRQIKEIQDQYKRNPITEFMNKYFPDIERVKLMDIIKVYKLVNKKMIKQEELAVELEETEVYKVTNVKNIRYVTKIKP